MRDFNDFFKINNLKFDNSTRDKTFHILMLLIKIFLSGLHLGALAFFALKYLRFDVKSSNESNSVDIPENLRQKIEEIRNEETKPQFDRFVYFLLDAWRWDFLFSERTNMEFLKG